MPRYCEADKIVSDVLIDAWERAEEEGDDYAADAMKRALQHLGLPWVRIDPSRLEHMLASYEPPA